jgi:hypothetical protein
MLLVAPSPFLHKKAPTEILSVQKIFYKKRAAVIL